MKRYAHSTLALNPEHILSKSLTRLQCLVHFHRDYEIKFQRLGPNNQVIRSRICATVAMTACYHAAKYGDSWISSTVKKNPW